MPESDGARGDGGEQLEAAAADATSGGERVSPSLRRAALYAVRGAVCALVPVPFLDDHLLARTRRGLARELAKRYGYELGPGESSVLAGVDPGRGRGCIVGGALALLVRFPLKLLRRVFRSVVFFLAMRDATNSASRLFHESYLLELALCPTAGGAAGTGAVPSDSATEVAPLPRPPIVRAAIDRTLAEIDPRPIEQALAQAFRGSWRLLGAGARRLARLVRREGPQAVEGATVLEEESAPPGLLTRLATAISHQGAYLSKLTETLERHLAIAVAEAAAGPATGEQTD